MDETQLVNVDHNTDTAILFPSCDLYRDIWPAQFQLFFKYWSDCPYPIFLGSNEAIHPDPRVTPILVGPDIDYSTNLIKMLTRIEHEWIIIWLDDLLLCRPVDSFKLGSLVKAGQSAGAAYLKLLANHPRALSGNPTSMIAPIPRGLRYRVSLTVGLWQKKALVEILRPGESAWDIERVASLRSNQMDTLLCYLSPRLNSDPPIAVVNGVIKGRWTLDAVRLLEREGMSNDLKGRRVQSLMSYMYVRAYILRLDLLYMLGRQWRTANWNR